jgi:hypothetical protein
MEADMADHKADLLSFLDRRAFAPVLEADPANYSEQDRTLLLDLQCRARIGRDRYYNSEFNSAEEICAQFLRDITAAEQRDLNRTLDRLRLPALPDVKGEFLALCERLGVPKPQQPHR